MAANPDRRDLSHALSTAGAEFLFVRGHAVIHVLSIEDPLTNRRAVGRPQDLLDVALLERRAGG